MLSGLVQDKKFKNKSFWEFVEKLKSMRVIFNTILQQKFKALPKIYRKNSLVTKIFREAKKSII